MICLMNSNPFPCVSSAQPLESPSPPPVSTSSNSELKSSESTAASDLLHTNQRLFEAPTDSSLADDRSCRSSPSSTASDASDSHSSSNEDLSQYSLKDPSAQSTKTDDDIHTDKEPDKKLNQPGGWQRLLVNNKNCLEGEKPEWVVNFVSPEGKRFYSHQELTCYLGENGIDPLQISFLNNHESNCQSDYHFHHQDAGGSITGNSNLCVEVCNMKQNIFDIRKRKGRKRSRDGIGRQISRRSTTSSEGSAVEELEPESKKFAPEEPVISEEVEPVVGSASKSKKEPCRLLNESNTIVAEIVEDLLPSCADSRPQTPASAVVPFVDLLEGSDDIIVPITSDEPEAEKDPLSIDNWSGHSTPTHVTEPFELSLRLSSSSSSSSSDDDEESDINKGIEIESCNLDDDSDDSDVQIIEEKEEKEVVIASLIEEIRSKSCKVKLADLFRESPLANFNCFGCSKPYGSTNGFSFDFECQVMSIVCSQCEWWTSRKMVTKSCKLW